MTSAGVAAGSSATAPSWTCSTSGVSYTLVCQSCVPPPPSTIASKSSTLSGLSTGQLQTICIVIGCMLTSMTLVMSAMRLDTCSVLLAMLVKRYSGGHSRMCLHEQGGWPCLYLAVHGCACAWLCLLIGTLHANVLLVMPVNRSLGGHACICLHEQDGCPMTLSCWQERKSQ